MIYFYQRLLAGLLAFLSVACGQVTLAQLAPDPSLQTTILGAQRRIGADVAGRVPGRETCSSCFG